MLNRFFGRRAARDEDGLVAVIAALMAVVLLVMAALVVDLGLARRLGSRECLAGDILAGTYGYLSPESFLTGATLTQASDVYSLGAVLYELLAGQPMFDEAHPDRLALLHLRQTPPDVREAALDVPPPLAQLVMRMLAKQPLRRPAAEEIVRELTRLEISLLGSR